MAVKSGNSSSKDQPAPLRNKANSDAEPTFTKAERAHALRIVDLMGPIVPALAVALGPRTEVVLHDLTRIPKTIAAIGGTLTGRTIGGPPTDLGLRTFRSGWHDHMIGYRTEGSDGMVMRSSSLFFRAPSGTPVACLCINSDVGMLVQAQEALAALIATSTADPLGEGDSPKSAENFPTSVDTLIEGILREAIAAVGVPVGLMKKEHKIEVVRELELRGFFTIREAVDTAAARLKVSRYTVYNYLNELQSARDGRASDNTG